MSVKEGSFLGGDPIPYNIGLVPSDHRSSLHLRSACYQGGTYPLNFKGHNPRSSEQIFSVRKCGNRAWARSGK